MKRYDETNTRDINQIIMVSAWGITIVVASLLFLSVGRWIDATLNTEPAFMIGLMVLAIVLCTARLYEDFDRTRHHLNEIRHHQV